MGRPGKRLVSDALELPAHERAQLAHRLIISLDEDIEENPAEARRAREDGRPPVFEPAELVHFLER